MSFFSNNYSYTIHSFYIYCSYNNIDISFKKFHYWLVSSPDRIKSNINILHLHELTSHWQQITCTSLSNTPYSLFLPSFTAHVYFKKIILLPLDHLFCPLPVSSFLNLFLYYKQACTSQL